MNKMREKNSNGDYLKKLKRLDRLIAKILVNWLTINGASLSSKPAINTSVALLTSGYISR